MNYNRDSVIKVNYSALHQREGLVDLQMKVYDETNALFTTIIMTEIVGSGGIYTASFVPDEIGQWRIRVTSIANHDDYSKIYEVDENTEKISRILGLSQENYRIFSPVYDINNNLLTATMKTYANASDCNNNINPVATYQVTSTYDNKNRMKTYKVVKL
jgi:hypothetical protein